MFSRHPVAPGHLTPTSQVAADPCFLEKMSLQEREKWSYSLVPAQIDGEKRGKHGDMYLVVVGCGTGFTEPSQCWISHGSKVSTARIDMKFILRNVTIWVMPPAK